MTTARINTTTAQSDTVETPWYELIADPKPPEDSMQQNRTITDVTSILWLRYDSVPDVFVSGPTNVFHEVDGERITVAPDCYVVMGVDAQTIEADKSYRVWEWCKPPDFVAEVASESTAESDLDQKRRIYARLGVTEYWRFDATGGDYYGEPLVGERLASGEYRRYELFTDESGDRWSHSDVLGLDFYYRTDGRFWVKDSHTGEWLNFLSAEREARQQAERRIAELEAELEQRR